MSPPRENGEAALGGAATREVNLALNNGVRPTRSQIDMWTRHAQWIAGQFSASGEWKHFRALLRHVIGMRTRMTGGMS
jgi:hypothetical protein